MVPMMKNAGTQSELSTETMGRPIAAQGVKSGIKAHLAGVERVI